jgi:hypothetical protein
MAENKGAAYRNRFGEGKDSRAEFVVREASDNEANAAEKTRLTDTDRRIDQLRQRADRDDG